MAISSHCLGCSTSLSLPSIDSVTRGMRNCIGICIEIVKLIKFSLKHENMLEDMKICKIIIAESYEDLNKDYDEVPLKIKKISSIRWTMQYVRFIKIKDN